MPPKWNLPGIKHHLKGRSQRHRLMQELHRSIRTPFQAQRWQPQAVVQPPKRHGALEAYLAAVAEQQAIHYYWSITNKAQAYNNESKRCKHRNTHHHQRRQTSPISLF